MLKTLAGLLALAFAGVLVDGVSTAGAKKDAPAPRSLADIKQKLTEILSPKSDKKLDEPAHALKRLQAYRYLAGVPYEDMALDDKYNSYCQAAAKLCLKLGKLDHKPERPKDMPEDEYKLAFLGASRSNLGFGFQHLAASVDAWMDDSDAANIAHLGHRRWCLNPRMVKTGLARAGVVTAMYIFDESRVKAPDYDFVCWPPRGLMPVEFFKAHQAWHVSLNPAKFEAPPKDIEAKIFKADAEGNKAGAALKLDHLGVDTTPFGIPLTIIFRPEKIVVGPGGRYVVEIEGLRPKSTSGPKAVRYLVEFVKWK